MRWVVRKYSRIKTLIYPVGVRQELHTCGANVVQQSCVHGADRAKMNEWIPDQTSKLFLSFCPSLLVLVVCQKYPESSWSAKAVKKKKGCKQYPCKVARKTFFFFFSLSAIHILLPAWALHFSIRRKKNHLRKHQFCKHLQVIQWHTVFFFFFSWERSGCSYWCLSSLPEL